VALARLFLRNRAPLVLDIQFSWRRCQHLHIYIHKCK